MKKIDWFLGYIFFGFILFITFFCIGSWADVSLGGPGFIGCAAGATLGVAANLVFLKRIVRRMYSLSPWALAAVFVLYSIGIFGFFMGVPVFNALMGAAAGWYVGRRAKLSAAPQGRKPLSKAVWFSTGVLTAFCAASAWLALRDPTTAANLEGMLGLDFHITTGMIWSIILIGGALLLAAQAAATLFSAKVAERLG